MKITHMHTDNRKQKLIAGCHSFYGAPISPIVACSGASMPLSLLKFSK